MTDMIKCDNLCMCYDNSYVFCDLSFTVSQGEFIAITGKNGCGKSTLIKGLLGLAKYKGNLMFFNLERNQIGYLPQQTPISEDFPATVREVVLSGCIGSMGFAPFYKDKHRKKTRTALEKLCINELEHRRFRDLSGGQKQRVLIARSLCAADKLLLLDEPVSGLDSAVRSELYDIIGSLRKKEAMTIIMISHDLGYSIANADKILHISDNGDTPSFFGTPDEYKETPFYHAMKGADVNAKRN